MKKILILLMAIISLTVFAQEEEISGSSVGADCSYICTKLYGSYDQLECLKEIRGKTFDAKACKVCDGIYGNYDTRLCMRTIANKSYNSGEISVCSSMYGNYSIINCLETAGSTNTHYPGSCDIARLKRQVDGAINNFKGGNHSAGMNTLYNMKSELNSCH